MQENYYKGADVMVYFRPKTNTEAWRLFCLAVLGYPVAYIAYLVVRILIARQQFNDTIYTGVILACCIMSAFSVLSVYLSLTEKHSKSN